MPKKGKKETILKDTTFPTSEKISKKPRKKKRVADPTFNPKTYGKRRKVQSNTSSHGANIIQLMGASTPKAPKIIVKGHTVKTPIKYDTQIVRSPNYTTESLLNKEVLYTPNKKNLFVLSRTIETLQGNISTYLPINKVKECRLSIPKTPLETIHHLEIPEASFDPIIDRKITIKDIEQADTEKKQAQKMGQATRAVSQNEVMTLSAREAVWETTQIETKPKLLHWIHFIAHSLFGNETQTPHNLAIATKYCNAEMELVNPVIKKILLSDDHPDELYLSIYPTWVKGYEKIRLLDRLTLLIKNAPEDAYTCLAKIEFDALTLKAICTSEIKIVEQILLDIFRRDQPAQSKEISFLKTNDDNDLISFSDDEISLCLSPSPTEPVLTPLFERQKEMIDSSLLPKPLMPPEADAKKVLKPT